MPLVSAQNISVKYGQKVILDEVHLTVGQGEIVSLIGPNGAGKSTLVKVILGLIRPHTGKVEAKADLRLGYMPQGLLIEDYMPLSVERFLQLARPKNAALLNGVVHELRINHLLALPIQNISGGELQRVLLARALLREPHLLVLDEPVQGVDITGQEELYQLIMHIRDSQGCGILMVSHDLHLVMAGTDSVVCLNKHVCCSGHPSTVSQHPEFLNLFGTLEPKKLAIYTHRHNHQHDLGGEICN